MITIPDKNRRYIQGTDSDILGNLFSTFNCDFKQNKGALRLGRRLVLNTATADLTQLNSYPVGFKYFNNGSSTSVYTAAGSANTGYAFSALTPDGGFGRVVTAGSPATVDSTTSDIEVGFGELYISSASDAKVYYLNSSNVWGNLNAGSAGNVMMMCYFNYQNRMYVTKGGYQIQSWDSSHTVASPAATYTLSLATTEIITFIKASNNRIWIGTVNVYGGRGYVYSWDGSTSTGPQATYKLDTAGALACVIDGDVPYIIDTNGRLLHFNGGTFVATAGFNRKNDKQLYNAAYSLNKRFIHPNGMAIIEGEINVLADLTNNDVAAHGGTQEDCNPSGVWEYSRTNKDLKHKTSFTLTKSGGTINDFGQVRIFGAGGLAEAIVTSSVNNGSYLAGCSYYTDATTTTSGIFYDDLNDTLAKCGSYVSARLFSVRVLKDIWHRLYALHLKFLNASDKIVVKWRSTIDIPTEVTITWLSSTAFYTSTDLTPYMTIGTDGLYGEVDVIQGLGSGKCSHITNIQKRATDWLVQVDETYTGATGTSKARLSKWIKAGTIQDVLDYDSVQLGLKNGIQIQVKLWMSWTGQNELISTVITNAPTAQYQ